MRPRCPTCSGCAGCFNEGSVINSLGCGPAVAVTLTSKEIEELIFATSDAAVRARLRCALDLIAPERVIELEDELTLLP